MNPPEPGWFPHGAPVVPSAGFGGYLVLMLVGLAYSVFLPASAPQTGGRIWTFLLCNTGLGLAMLGIAFGLPLVAPVGALLVLAGVLVFWPSAPHGF